MLQMIVEPIVCWEVKTKKQYQFTKMVRHGKRILIRCLAGFGLRITFFIANESNKLLLSLFLFLSLSLSLAHWSERKWQFFQSGYCQRTNSMKKIVFVICHYCNIIFFFKPTHKNTLQKYLNNNFFTNRVKNTNDSKSL